MKRWQLLAIPQILLFGGMLVMLVVHPNAITSGVQSTRALVVNGLLLAGWLLLSLVIVPRVVKSATWDAVLLSAVAIAAIVVLVVPTLRNERVVEEFPAAVVEATTSPTTVPGAPPTTAPAAPVRISTGELRGIGHDATGTASIFRVPTAARSSRSRPSTSNRARITVWWSSVAPIGRARATDSNSTVSEETRARSTTRCHPEPTPATDGRCSSGAGRSVCPSPTPAKRQSENRRATCSSR